MNLYFTFLFLLLAVSVQHGLPIPVNQCTTALDCPMNAYCDSNVCMCDPDYIGTVNNTCINSTGLPIPMKKCTTALDCPMNAYCDSNVCTCDPDYIRTVINTCINSIDYCDADGDCMGVFAVCVMHKCSCASGYIMINGLCEIDIDSDTSTVKPWMIAAPLAVITSFFILFMGICTYRKRRRVSTTASRVLISDSQPPPLSSSPPTASEQPITTASKLSGESSNKVKITQMSFDMSPPPAYDSINSKAAPEEHTKPPSYQKY